MGQYYKGAWILTLVITFVAILLSSIWWGVSTIKASVINHLTEVHPLQRGVIEKEIEGQAILIRKEELLVAPSHGKLIPLVKEGQRTRAGAPVAQLVLNSVKEGVQQEKIKLKAPRSGLVSYQVDGLEEVTTLDQLEQLGYEKLWQKLDLEGEGEKKDPNSFVSGEPLCKIVDNLNPFHLALRLSKEGSQLDFQEGKYLRIGFPGVMTEKVKMKIQKVIKVKGGYEVIVSFTPVGNELLNWRKGSVLVTKTRYEGYLVDSSALVKKGGQDGVFIVYKERARFEPVDIVGKLEDQAVILGAKIEGKVSRIGLNAQVILNPRFMEEGQKVQ